MNADSENAGNVAPHKIKKKSARWHETDDGRDVMLGSHREITKSNGRQTLVNDTKSICISNLLEIINPNNKKIDEKAELRDIRIWGSDKDIQKSGWTGNGK